MALLAKLIAMPYFLFCVFFFYWSNSVGSLIYRVKFLNLLGKRKDMHDWGEMMNSFFGTRYKKHGRQSLVKGRRIIYLCNHRSWADFFVDIYLTEGTAAAMSRSLVFFVFPFFMTSVGVLKGIILFKRGAIQDKQKFNKWLDDLLDSSIVPSLLVYPEGHRSTKTSYLPLKRGMLYYAHSRQLPIQIIITRGKEFVLSEKRMCAGFGATLVTGFSDLIESKDYPDFETFSAKVMKVWDVMWTEVYGADVASLPALRQEAVPEFDYPMDMRWKQMVVSAACCGAFLSVLGAGAYLVKRCVLAVLPLPVQVAVGVMTAVVCGVSFASSIVSGVPCGPSKGPKAS